MSTIQAIILGIIQGITEFLPISSSGHLVFVPKFLGWADQGLLFDAFIHLGTLFAVVVYFRKRLLEIITSVFSKKTESENSRKVALFLALSVVPSAFAGFLMSEVLEVEIRSPLVVAFNLIGWGIVLGLAEKWQKKRAQNERDTRHMTWTDLAAIAFSQVIALIPGTSRSGITMTAGLFRNLSPSAAAEFSFLMSIPVVAAAGALKLIQLARYGVGDIETTTLIAGCVAAAVSGFIAIAALMKLVQRIGFMPFVVYRIIVGILIIAFIV